MSEGPENTVKVSGSGRVTDGERIVVITLHGTDDTILRLIDHLELVALHADSMPVMELCRQINYRAGAPVDHSPPSGEITI